MLLQILIKLNLTILCLEEAQKDNRSYYYVLKTLYKYLKYSSIVTKDDLL